MRSPVLCNPFSVPTLQMKKPRPAGTARGDQLGLRSSAHLSPPCHRRLVLPALERELTATELLAAVRPRVHGSPLCSVEPQGVTGQLTWHLAERGFRGSWDTLVALSLGGGGALQHSHG